MSECSFGGSFGLVRNGQHPLRSRITNYLRRAAMHQIIPFAKLIPFLPPVQDEEMDKMIYNILDRREAQENKLARRDLLQILLEAHAESPETVTKRDVKAEMIVFLYERLSPIMQNSQLTRNSGWLEAKPLALRQLSFSSSC